MQQLPERRVIHSRLRPGLGTFVAVEAEAQTLAHVVVAIGAAFAAIAKVEALMHPTRAGSDLRAIHAADIGASVAIHPWTWDVLALSQRLNKASNGLFDPCLPRMRGRISDLELQAPQFVTAHAPLHLDFGGIAKGFAVDRALGALRSAGCDAGLVNAGGDVAVFGNRTHDIICPAVDGADIVVTLHNSALASSDASSSDRPIEHRGYYHGVDLREIHSGKITVHAAQAAVADGLTKCLLADRGNLSVALLASFDARRITRREAR